MKTYIRRKGTKRWLRFKYFEEMGDWYDFDRRTDVQNSVEGYHEENANTDSEIYEVTQDKKEIITVEVTTHLEPVVSGRII